MFKQHNYLMLEIKKQWTGTLILRIFLVHFAIFWCYVNYICMALVGIVRLHEGV